MLTAIELENFKCFHKLVLPLRPFTLLTGKNASGKSTVLQAWVLLQQTAFDAEWSKALHLNGSLINLGSVADVVDKVTSRSTCAIGLRGEPLAVKWTFAISDRRAMALPIQRVEAVVGSERQEWVGQGTDKALHRLVPVDWLDALGPLDRHQNTQYISAERVGPRETYPLVDSERRYVGVFGQYAPALLYWLADERVSEGMVVPSAPPTLRNQVQAWMRELFPGCGIDVQLVRNANQVALGIRTSDETDYHRPQHVGFGLTHVLPIVTAALTARPGQHLLIENPETHLHPAGQSWMGQFLARVAATGIQVIVETHSDHVLNGLRRAVRSQHIGSADVAVHFFNERPPVADETTSQVISPVLDSKGDFDHWPEGFFDQFDKDMDFFADWG